MRDKFESVIQAQTKILDENNRIFNIVGIVKLILAVPFVISLYFMFTQWDRNIFKLYSGGLLLIQTAIWIYHLKIGDIIAHAKGLIKINQRHIDRITGEWTKFKDTGEEFVNYEHPYSYDLDIVGKKSLFQFINSTHTWSGRTQLADDLLNPAYSQAEIKERQQAISELSSKHELASDLEYQFSKIGVDPATPNFLSTLQSDEVFIRNKFLKFILSYLPIFTITFAGVTIIFGWEHLYMQVALLFMAQTLIWAGGLLITLKYLQGINSLQCKLDSYGKVLDMLHSSEFSSSKIQEIQSRLTGSELSAVKGIKSLATIVNKTNIRSNALIYFSLNIILLWDYDCALQFEAWRKKHSAHCGKWFSDLGELEALVSFSNLEKVCDNTCFPEISENKGIHADELGHPLISNDVRVTNEVKLKDNIIIISGSNMSGKTTYLRAVGINTVLARAGSAVCAKSMICSVFNVITSMRILDDLNSGVSTFYAELRRVKSIIDSSKIDDNTLFLIDEIFRGTNSVDRLSGATAVITKLSQQKVLGLVSTHDLELCDLEQSVERISNCSFSEYYENGKIRFDYKMTAGKSKTTNAKHLMQMVGIL